jgi:LCP family protein required for cell wall assembly
LLLVAGLLLVALLAAPVAAKYFYSEQLGSQINRVPDVFTPLDAAARPPATPAVTTFLLVGTDTRSDTPTTGDEASGNGTGGDRSDVLMFAQIDPSGPSATVVSIPRDSWVEIPGHGKNKINAAYAFGGPSLLIQTFETLTDLRVDHLAVIDFAGFQALVDAVGGIDVNVLAPTSLDGVQFQAGPNHLDGYAALKFVRQRHGLPDGDLDRAQREQSALRAILVKITSNGTLSDLGGVYRFLDAARESIGVDDTLTNGGLRALGSRLRNLHPTDVRFVLAPVGSFGREGTQAVDYLDGSAADLWLALRTGEMTKYLQVHRDDILGEATR